MKKFRVWFTTAGTSPTCVYVDAATKDEAVAKVKSWQQPRFAASFNGHAY